MAPETLLRTINTASFSPSLLLYWHVIRTCVEMSKRGQPEEEKEGGVDYLMAMPEDVLLIILELSGMRGTFLLILSSKEMGNRVKIMMKILAPIDSDDQIDLIYKPGFQFNEWPKLTVLLGNRAPKCKEKDSFGLPWIAPRLTSLSFIKTPFPVYRNVMEMFFNLTSLHLRSCLPAGKNLDWLTKLIKLRVLCLEYCEIVNYTGIGFLRDLEVLSITSQYQYGEDNDEHDLTPYSMDNSICFLSKLKSLRLRWAYTAFAYLDYLPQLLFLDLIDTRCSLMKEQILETLPTRFGKLKNLQYLALPRFILPLDIELRNPQLTTLIVHYPQSIQYLPLLKYYRFKLKEYLLVKVPDLIGFITNAFVHVSICCYINAENDIKKISSAGLKLVDKFPSDDYWEFVEDNQLSEVPISILRRCDRRYKYMRRRYHVKDEIGGDCLCKLNK